MAASDSPLGRSARTVLGGFVSFGLIKWNQVITREKKGNQIQQVLCLKSWTCPKNLQSWSGSGPGQVQFRSSPGPVQVQSEALDVSKKSPRSHACRHVAVTCTHRRNSSHSVSTSVQRTCVHVEEIKKPEGLHTLLLSCSPTYATRTLWGAVILNHLQKSWYIRYTGKMVKAATGRKA
jgi:hypothetical protein